MQLGLIDKKEFQNLKELGKGNLPVRNRVLHTENAHVVCNAN